MQWLNKVDDALDRVFLRPGGPGPAAGEVGNSNGTVQNSSTDVDVAREQRAMQGAVPSSARVSGVGAQTITTAPPPPPPPPPPAVAERANPLIPTSRRDAPSATSIAASNIDKLHDPDNRQTESEAKLLHLANMMKQLEKDAKESYQKQHNNGTADDRNNQQQQTSQEDAETVTIPLLPLSSIGVTQDADSPIRIQPHRQTGLQTADNSQSGQHIQQPNRSAQPPPPPPPPPINQPPTNQIWEPSTPRLPQHHPTPSPLPTPRFTPRTAGSRPTPGIIRRKIRSPSVSPSNSTSPLPSFDNSDRLGNSAVPPPPPPPPLFVDDVGLPLESRGDAVIESAQNRAGAVQPPTRVDSSTISTSMQQSLLPPTLDVNAMSARQMDESNILSKAAIQAANTANLMEQTPVPSANIMVHRSPRLNNPFMEVDTEDKPKPTTHKPSETKKLADDTIQQHNDDSSSTTFHSQISNRSDLTDDEDDDDSMELQAQDFALPSTVSEPPSVKSWNPSFNRYGIVHVRVLRAQRLPCAVGTFVVASLALPPWKGKIRIPSLTAVDGPDGAGVCLRWDRPPSRGCVVDDAVGDSFSHSMVHAYNNKDTPVPIVSFTLSISSMGGVFEKFLCSVAFSCQEIMKSPGAWKRKWYSATTDPMIGSMDASSPSSRRHSSFLNYVRESSIVSEYDNEDSPLILLEACFEPKMEDTEQVFISEDSDTLGPIPRDLVIKSSPEKRLRHMPDSLYSSIEDDSASKTSSLTSVIVRHHSSKAHLLRVRSFWTPAWCAVCSKVITSGWLQGSFECEACHIFCCKDCQLQVDVSIPCGSELSRIAVKKAQQYQVSIGQVMTTLAPYTNKDVSGEQHPGGINGKLTRHTSDSITKIEGVGILSIRVLNACLFEKAYPSDAEPTDIFKIDSNNHRHGDHYVRISWLGSKDSKRTKTVLQTAKPIFDADEMQFDVAHYGMEYKLEVVDANTDRAVGSCLLSPQALLQMQRDSLLARWDQLLLSILHFRDESEPRRMKIELRSATKDGFGLNFYNSAKITDDSKEKNSTSALAGAISGWIELDLNFEEDSSGLFYSSNPRQCPPRATEEFDIALINLHIARISAVIEDVQKLVSNYVYLISWENVYLTSSSLAVFVITTLRFNLEYLGALPVGMLVLYMLYLGQIRLSGHFKDRWITKEKNALIDSESKIDQHYNIHRPIGLLQIGNLRGKNLRSRDLGLPGSFYVSIAFDPLRYASEKKKKSISKVDASSSCIHQIGNTISPGITSSPIWTEIRPSAELNRLKHLLPDNNLLGEGYQSTNSLVKYPILQPITKDRSLYVNQNEAEQRDSDIGLLPWSSSTGAVVLQVRFSEVLGSFQLFENVLGEVVLPLSKLAAGQEVEGWFRLLNAGTTETAPGELTDEDAVDQKPRSLTDDESIVDDQEMAIPELYVKVKFSAASNPMSKSNLETETSRVICEEMVRTASMSKEGNIGVMIGSSINTINTVRTLGGTLQNQISNVVNIIEMIRNAFNFSSPRITCLLLVCLSTLWFILALIPTRFVILLAGLGQYGATYYSKFIFVPKATKSDKPDDDEMDAPAVGNIVENLFLSIPTDEDLRRTYFWEARRVGEREREKFANTKRQNRLKKLWKASWHGTVKVKEKRQDSSSPKNSKNTWSWETAFIIIEGHRFIWWRSEKHFDTGEAPLGQIFFAGHSGLAGLSPLDLRELSKDEIPFIVSVFGRGSKTQQKLTLLAPNQKVKDGLENAVIASSSDRKAD